MDNKYIEQLRTQVKDALRTDNMRYQHTLGVANTSACLAMLCGHCPAYAPTGSAPDQAALTISC